MRCHSLLAQRRVAISRVCGLNPCSPRMDWSLIAESHQFGIYRSVSSVKAWWAKFTAYAIANRLVRSRPAEYPTTHGSSPHL